MNYFENFVSNSIAGSGNQYFFSMTKGETRSGRVFYKITCGGSYRYSLLFSNTLDSTYADGSISQKNLVCNSWQIHRARIGVCDTEIFETGATVHNDRDVAQWFDLTFDGHAEKEVGSGEMFGSDPIELAFESSGYLCLELVFSGTMIPYHEESLLPVFVKHGETWVYDRKMPFVGMIGCDRKVAQRIAFWGDSITQGIGTPLNSYAHWNALIAKMLGDEFAYWNIGIGYARANDAASLGAWWNKAKQNDIVVLCLGANDILQNMPEEQIKNDLKTIVRALGEQGIRVVLQTIPPFEYTNDQISVWKNVNEYIRTSLAKEAELLFDVVPLLSAGEPNHLPKYGGHPDETGCAVWAEALCKELVRLL